jgi:hypothetical protein
MNGMHGFFIRAVRVGRRTCVRPQVRNFAAPVVFDVVPAASLPGPVSPVEHSVVGQANVVQYIFQEGAWTSS